MGRDKTAREVHAEVEVRKMGHTGCYVLKIRYIHNTLPNSIRRVTIKRQPNHEILHPLMHEHDAHPQVLHISRYPAEGVKVG